MTSDDWRGTDLIRGVSGKMRGTDPARQTPPDGFDDLEVPF